LTSVQDIYNKKSPWKIQEGILEQHVKKFSQKYESHSELVKFIERITVRTEQGKPTFKVIAEELRIAEEKKLAAAEEERHKEIMQKEELEQREIDQKKADVERRAKLEERLRNDEIKKTSDEAQKIEVETIKAAFVQSITPSPSEGGTHLNSMLSGVARNVAPELKGNTFVGADGRTQATFIKCIDSKGNVT